MSLPYLLPATSAFIQRAPRMLIGGDWVEAADGQTMTLHNPATGEVLCVVPRATPEDVDRAVLAAVRPSMIRPGPAPGLGSGRTCCGNSPT